MSKLASKPKPKLVEPIDPDINGLVTFTWILNFLDIGKAEIHKILRGYIERAPGSEYYPLKNVGRGVRKYYKTNGSGRISSPTKDATTARVNDARAVQIEMENAVRAKTLMPVEERDAQFTLVYGALSVELDTLSAQVTKDLELRRVIDEKVAGMKIRLNDKWKKLLSGREDVSSDEDEEEAA